MIWLQNIRLGFHRFGKRIFNLAPSGRIHASHEELALIDINAILMMDINVYASVATRCFDKVDLFAWILCAQ